MNKIFNNDKFNKYQYTGIGNVHINKISELTKLNVLISDSFKDNVNYLPLSIYQLSILGEIKNIHYLPNSLINLYIHNIFIFVNRKWL